jgi:arylformamidase
MIYDITLPITAAMVVWPGTDPIKLTQLNDTAAGDTATVSRYDIPSHFGTHVDAPKHFITGGAGIESLDLDALVGEAHVIDVGDVDLITVDVLENLSIPADAVRVLFKTRCAEWWREGAEVPFREDFVALDEAAARWLVERGVKLVGVDYLSVAPFDAPVPTHEVLLSNRVIPVEGLNLADIEPGVYQLVCLPMLVKDGDGAPARTILIRD